MQVVILCGGSGTRLREQTEFIPKPMIHIGGKPMLWHIMKLYSHYGFNDFVLALGYRQEAIKDYFLMLDMINNDIWIRAFPAGRDVIIKGEMSQWNILLTDTGIDSMKGARLKRIEKYIVGDNFMMTYGDGIGDIDLTALADFHESHGKMVTVTGVQPNPRFGEIQYEGEGCVLSFSEKPHDGVTLINGGFFVFNKKIFNYLSEDKWCDLEIGPLELLAQKGEMMVYHHTGYWGCMDTIRDMDDLNALWSTGQARWKVWNV